MVIGKGGVMRGFGLDGKGEVKLGEVEAFLGRNTSFEGKMSFEGMARLDGKLEGEVSGDILVIGETATVDAHINVGSLIVDGKVSGKASATGKIEIHSTGKLYGNIATPSLIIREGGLFQGASTMDRAAAKAKKVAVIEEKEGKEEEAITT
jgi:cytoskeletal protein CcmA (bactofilin family)